MCADRQDNDFVNVLICAAARLCVPSRPLNSFTLNDWVSFVLWLDKVGLLLPLVAIGIDFPYLVAESIAKQKVDLHIAHQKRLNEELFKFSNAAKANRLHFVALKGSALSVQLYESPYARHSTDIDILIDPEDAAKAGFVAAQCGFNQPMEYFRLLEERGIRRAEQGCFEIAPFQTRKRQDFDSMAEYVKCAEGNVIVIDVHDRISSIACNELQSFLWDTTRVCLGSYEVDVLTASSLIAYLTLAAYSDSEGYAANIQNGPLGIKLYFDLFVSMHVYGEENTQKAIKMLFDLGKGYESKIVLANLHDIFSDYFEYRRIAIGELLGSTYVGRFLDTRKRNLSANFEALDRLTSLNGANLLYADECKEIRWEICHNVMITASVWVDNQILNIRWTIPNAVHVEIDCFVFQVRAYPVEIDGFPPELRFNLFQESGLMRCDAVASSRYSCSGKGDKEHRGISIDVKTRGRLDSGMRFEVAVKLADMGVAEYQNKKLLLNGGIYKNHCGPVYHEIWRDMMTLDGCAMGSVKL